MKDAVDLLNERIAALKEELQEQSRLLGMGAEREKNLRTENERLRKNMNAALAILKPPKGPCGGGGRTNPVGDAVKTLQQALAGEE